MSFGTARQVALRATVLGANWAASLQSFWRKPERRRTRRLASWRLVCGFLRAFLSALQRSTFEEAAGPVSWCGRRPISGRHLQLGRLFAGRCGHTAASVAHLRLGSQPSSASERLGALGRAFLADDCHASGTAHSSLRAGPADELSGGGASCAGRHTWRRSSASERRKRRRTCWLAPVVGVHLAARAIYFGRAAAAVWGPRAAQARLSVTK